LEQGRGRKTVGKEKKGGGKGMEGIQLRMSRGEQWRGEERREGEGEEEGERARARA
jgi:hypothetical protein